MFCVLPKLPKKSALKLSTPVSYTHLDVYKRQVHCRMGNVALRAQVLLAKVAAVNRNDDKR